MNLKELINISVNHYLHESKHVLEKSKDKTLKVQLLYMYILDPCVQGIMLDIAENSQRLPHVMKIEIFITMKYQNTMCQSDLE